MQVGRKVVLIFLLFFLVVVFFSLHAFSCERKKASGSALVSSI